MKKSVRWLWRIFIGFALLFNFLIFSFYFNWFGNMPDLYELENPTSAESSQIFSSDGKLMGRYFLQDRSNSKHNEISKNVYDALIATEDVRFYEHSGIDGIALLRAITALGKDGGASTLTQQLAKNMLGEAAAHNKLKRLYQKIKEWVWAVKLERNLTKDEIITLYLNTVPFPDNTFGIKNASLTFFNKTPDKLNVDEAAVLIGSLKGNSIFNPRTHPAKTLLRRNTVIEQMEKYNKITMAQAISYKAKPLQLDYNKIDYHDGEAPYFRQVLEKSIKTILKDIKKPGGSESYDIYKDGLKIYTTIDTRYQKYAEEAVEEHMHKLQREFMSQGGYRNYNVWKKHQEVINNAIKNSERFKNLKEEGGMTDAEIIASFKQPVKMRIFAWNKNHYADTTMTPFDSIMYTKMFLQAGFMVMDPFTGEIKAWVGGINHDFFQFDHVNINTKRQVGSTIKPLLYCLAVDNGFSPCGSVSCAPQYFGGKYYDAGGSSYGMTSMKNAIAQSINNAALYLIKQVGIPSFVDFIHKCGITSNIVPYPSIALGVSDISIFEMLGAYTMFPTKGLHTDPIYITKIEDKNGNILKTFTPTQKEIISEATAMRMIILMRGVVNNGTASRIRRNYGLTMDAAGKTGTTNDQADAWFIGYTPQLLAGAWVGCDNRFLRFQSESLGQGAAAALPIWAYFFKKALADPDLGLDVKMKFPIPEDFNECDVLDQTSATRAATNNTVIQDRSSDVNHSSHEDPNLYNEGANDNSSKDQNNTNYQEEPAKTTPAETPPNQ